MFVFLIIVVGGRWEDTYDGEIFITFCLNALKPLLPNAKYIANQTLVDISVILITS